MELTRASLPAAKRPRVDRPAAGIVHLGLGAFFRAHQAVFTEDAIAEGGGDWGIVGVAPRSRAVVDALTAQDLLYSVTTLGPEGTSTRVIGALAGACRAAADPGAVVALLADPAIRVVTLTVTEKAYRLDPATGRLLLDDDLRADLETDRPPRTVPGLLIRGLAARERAGAGPIALVSCDNLPSNGHRLRGLVHHLAAATATADWVGANVTFPGTMVDRIVPASTPETLALAERALGVRDEAAVCGEPYLQWVIEDDFPGGRPAWDLAGAVMTDDARPWERLKLRALNGVHSAIAYLGALAGRETIAEALRIPGMLPAMRHLVADDIAPCLSPPPGVDTLAYGDEVLTRFENPAMGHRTIQVAMDGSQKLPQRVLHTIDDCRAAGVTPHWAALVVAAWMRFVQGTADDGSALPLDDPLADRIRARLAAAPSTPEGVVDAMLGLDTVFSADLAADAGLRAEIVTWLTALTKHGVEDTLAGVR
ncbi:mannitol dehydrogenase [Paractinoplanes deccanensis]|uniref:Mannitol-1-phosphate 5-dehydrogenase n=1 Tax=Paractinoplanes deccanensis TaxID=113561 RepID=A0ABQ3XXP5_9ACTN|nr:mannitol dehydrogenase family protein [Actinoplanes deccanensis]GID72442.1 mannitol dehydrogenase [Actinoplanes deccanensis]